MLLCTLGHHIMSGKEESLADRHRREVPIQFQRIHGGKPGWRVQDGEHSKEATGREMR